MAVKGVFTSDGGITGDRKGDFASALLYRDPTGSAPLLALSSGMESADASDTVITWFEENHLTGRTNITNNAGTGTSLIVDDASFVVANQIYLVEATGEYVFVTGVSGTTLTVVRGFATSSAVSTDGSSSAKPMQLIGTAHEEGSSRPTAITTIGAPVTNYMQIFRNSWDVTGTAQAIDYRTGNPKAKSKSTAAKMHAEDIERSLIWGVKTMGNVNNKRFSTMAGIQAQITSNVTAQSSDTQYTNIRDFLEDVFAKNIRGKPNERIAFCGNTVLGVLDTLALTWGQFNLSAGQTEFGMEITNWRTPFGKISLMTHPLFNENPLFTKDLMVLHPGAFRTRYLRRTKSDDYDTDGSRAGVDADYGVITTEMSNQYMAEATAGLFTGIDTPDTSNL